MNPLRGPWLKLFTKLARKYRRSRPPLKQVFNAAGFHLVPSDCYSAIPSVDEIENSFEYRSGPAPYLDCGLFDQEHMLAFLDELQPYCAEFEAPQDGDREQPNGFFWKNRWFMAADAMSYYAILRKLKPKRILEIGCGFSTLVASRAIGKNGVGEIHGIEPYPRAFVRSIPHLKELHVKPVQDIPLEYFNSLLRDGDVLFIDTTHTVKTGCDCLWLYLKILPKLTAKLHIHVHDIWLPEAFPKELQLQQNFFWTEQYLLLALLIGNPHYEILFGSHYHRVVNAARLTYFMAGQTELVANGGSFWFRSL